uniref:Orn/DAP/Arg decarboxylase 2 C-terminal domain-containing protein n=1 Tax=Esox lucius TaxID=8010 RepID=A0A3P8ZK87_ESOLU
FQKELDFKMTLLDIGGGFPGQNDFKLTFEEVYLFILNALKEFFPPSCGVSVIAEPGRYYVTSAVTLAANVIAKKVIMEELSSFNGKEGTGDPTNLTMMYYLNDGVYGSIMWHEVTFIYVQKPKPDEPVYPCVIWGPTCDSVDVVVKNTFLPELQVGDWLLIDNMGAYTHCISTTFNGFKKTPIYYVMSRDTM